jgi:hypothetical protein
MASEVCHPRPPASVNPRGGRPGPGPGWTAYTLGRRLNRLRWLLEQKVLLPAEARLEGARWWAALDPPAATAPCPDEALPKGGIAPLLHELIPLVRDLVGDPAAVPIERAVFEQIDQWDAWWDSEDMSGEVYETIDRYEQLARDGEFDSRLDDATVRGRRVADSVRGAIVRALGGSGQLVAALDLGRLVDQGIRPPDSMRFVFRWELHPSRWRRRRSRAYREAVANRRRAVGANRRFRAEHRLRPSPEEDPEGASGRGVPPPIPRIPKLPWKFQLVARFCPMSDLPPDPNWSLEVRSSWARLDMPLELPRVLSALYKRPVGGGALARVIARIDEVVMQCFSTSSAVGELPSPVGGPELGHGGDRGEEGSGPPTAPGGFVSSIPGEAASELPPRPGDGASVLPAAADTPATADMAFVAPPPDEVQSGPLLSGSAARSDGPRSEPVEGQGPEEPRGQRLVGAPTAAAEEYRRLRGVKRDVDPEDLYVGESLPILRVFEKIVQLNRDPLQPVLILGPTGAGKSGIAELIHRHSKRPGPFRREQASDNRLADFGFVKARWTGHGRHHGVANVPPAGTRGILEEASGGTVFVDELGELSPEFQVFLLDVLDRKPIPKAVGEGSPVVPDVRLIFATNENIEAAVQGGKLRKDLIRRIRAYWPGAR